MAFERNPTLQITRTNINEGAERARNGTTERVRNRLFVSYTLNRAVRDFFETSFGISTQNGRSVDDKYSELLDVNDFFVGGWSLEVRVLTNVEDIALYVPTLPLIVGYVSDFYVCVKTDSALSTVEILGFTHADRLGEADLSSNGLMAIMQLDDLQPWEQLKQYVESAKPDDLQQLALFNEWQTRARKLSENVEQILATEETFKPEQIELLVTSFRDEILRVYGQYAAPVPIQAIYNKLAARFNLPEPIRTRPDDPLVFASSEKEKASAEAPETESRYFQDSLNVPDRAGLYHHLIESDDAFNRHRRLKSILDQATGGKLHTPKRRREYVRRKKENLASVSEDNPIPPSITDPAERAELDEWFAEFRESEHEEQPSPGPEILPSDLNWDEFNFKTEYRTGYDDLVKDFYYPALAGADEYWRAVGFFSSSSLEAVGRPLGEFVGRGGRMRLITSVELSQQDYDAIAAGTRTESIVEQRLLERIRKDFDDPVGKGAELLLRLLEAGCLEIMVAIPDSGPGIFHEKVGVFLATAEFIAFSGSMNESRFALENNYECVDVFTSWEDKSRAESKKLHFERLWSNAAPGVTTITFPEAAKMELIRISGAGKSAQPQPSQSSSPIKMWKHQEEAIATFLKKERGVLEMATGTGKTKTSLEICRRLFENGQIQTMVISADGDDLLDQWYKELLTFVKQLNIRVPVLRHYKNHKEQERFFLNKGAIILTSRYFLPPVLHNLSKDEAARTILIHDEVHRLGSPSNRENLAGLSDHIRYRLGLSATPERQYDAEGNEFIVESIGEVIYRFGIEDAIRKKILSPFSYFPLEYTPDLEDRSSLQQVHKMAAARKQAGDPMSQEEIWIELAKVYKTSRAKLPVFGSFIEKNSELLRRCIIFVETREYGDEVLSIVHKYRHDFHVYYANEDSEVLRSFANGDIECLITCHRLSEGIDIHSLETVILFSSAKARLETIQRIGRCLRRNPRDPAKKANVVDFIRLPDDDSEGESNRNADLERRDWLSHLSQIEPEP